MVLGLVHLGQFPDYLKGSIQIVCEIGCIDMGRDEEMEGDAIKNHTY